MSEYREDKDETPWDMPREVFWNKKEGATVKRAQWVIDNRPEVSVDELARSMALQPEQVKQLIVNPGEQIEEEE